MRPIFKGLLISLTLLCPRISADGSSPLRVSFTKIESRASAADTVIGTVHSFDGRMVIAVTSPIIQYMLIDSAKTLIYNKDERTAIQLQQKGRLFLPFFHTFIGFFGGDQAIPVMDFKIRGSRKSGDTLVTTWAPKDKKTGFKGRIETVYWKDRPVQTRSLDNRGRELSRMEFSNDSLVNGRHVPFGIVTFTPNGAGMQREEVTFRDLAIGEPVPDSIKTMTIPAGIPVTVLEW